MHTEIYILHGNTTKRLHRVTIRSDLRVGVGQIEQICKLRRNFDWSNTFAVRASLAYKNIIGFSQDDSRREISILRDW